MRIVRREYSAVIGPHDASTARSESSPYQVHGLPERQVGRAVPSEPCVRWLGVLLAVLLLFSAGCASVRPCGNVDLGFVTTCDTSPEGADRCRVAGPIFEHQDTGEGQRFTGVRPFYALTADDDRERRLHEVLWPLGAVKHLGQESNWRFLLAYGHDFDNRDADSRHRGMVFPFVFWGRDKDDTPYFSVFPLGGTLNEFLGRDRIIYALFPLYAQSVIGDMRSWHVLWPFISRSRSEDVSRFRVFPFYGKSSDEGEYTKHFVLWPFWTHARYLEPGHSGSSYILFPLYGRTHREDQQGWMVLPPLFRWSKTEERTELSAPWPFFQYARGDYSKTYIWPLWGRREQGDYSSSFLLWPFVRTFHMERPGETQDRLVILPFVYHERVTQEAESGATVEPDVSARYFKLWPLVSYQRQEDTSRVRLLELWPLKHSGPVERNMAPFWTLYTRTATADLLEHELLWGLFRYRREGTESKHVSLFPLFSRSRCDADGAKRQWSLLLGLLGREQDEERSVWRVLWLLKFGG
ncbi:MAG: hypothetical protein ISS31_02085 [Kiritimatiellae bacterium]|nr:hypothetical protein [Kiritimatiellia bacterium]